MRNRNHLVRILFSAALVGVVIYFTIQRRKATDASSQPFPVGSPSAQGSSVFSWIPSYPFATVGDIRSRRTRTESDYGYEFATTDNLAAVASFYQDRLRAEGFSVETKVKGDAEIDIHAEGGERRRQLDVTINKSPTVTSVGVAAIER